MRRCVTELGMPGFQIGSHINEKNLDHSDLYPIYKAAEELDACLFVHPWDMHNWGGRMEKYWLPWLVGMPSETAQAICCVLMGGILERFPRLRLCFAHGGGSYSSIFGRVAHGYKVRPDLCATDELAKPPSTYHGQFWCDSHVNDRRLLALLADVIGHDKICLGTDYPFPLGELEVGQVVEEYCKSDSSLEKQKDKMFWKNGVSFLKIDESKLDDGQNK
ncbi:amidohydrolase domain-containing protein [Ditylenchus destructor]|uniref:2-amino-3-carboxymuconate-6-semialdehyde decarboxylase n=1 Tax=Ditylenchus destructor TaxID=166010 RepID=A0AAD4R4F2_9BILA|nr:amidohydrolase domain-containing protein [Ditylenchus destructor]